MTKREFIFNTWDGFMEYILQSDIATLAPKLHSEIQEACPHILGRLSAANNRKMKAALDVCEAMIGQSLQTSPPAPIRSLFPNARASAPAVMTPPSWHRSLALAGAFLVVYHFRRYRWKSRQRKKAQKHRVAKATLLTGTLVTVIFVTLVALGALLLLAPLVIRATI